MKIKCPKCDSKNIIPIQYGLPSFKMQCEKYEGKIKLGGCVVHKNNPDFHCRDCKLDFKKEVRK